MVGGFEYPPYDQIKYLYMEIMNQKIDIDDDPHYPEVDVSSLIHIQNENDLINARMSVIHYIWKEDGFPFNKMPSKIEPNISDEKFSNMNNLEKIDKITILMDYGIDSKAYLFVASKSNDKLVIYHQGHDGDFVLGKNTIQYFLEHGYSVLAFSMPLMGQNNNPTINLPNFGMLKMTSHDDLKFLESENLSPIKFFVEPITVALNYVQKEYAFSTYYMVGISGGGWTTVLYSAIDSQISKNYPVSGSVPMYLRFNNLKNMGDYEQMLPSFYQKANYLDLYVMGSYGNDRGQLQIFNKYDPCCFSGTGFSTYENYIKETISNLGKGTFEIFLDENNLKHSISKETLEIILKDMEF
jgi:hypothetical protein